MNSKAKYPRRPLCSARGSLFFDQLATGMSSGQALLLAPGLSPLRGHAADQLKRRRTLSTTTSRYAARCPGARSLPAARNAEVVAIQPTEMLSTSVRICDGVNLFVTCPLRCA